MGRNSSWGVMAAATVWLLGFPVAPALAEEQAPSSLDERAIKRGDRVDFEAMRREQFERVRRECAALQGAARQRCEWKLRYLEAHASRPQPKYKAEIEARKQRVVGGEQQVPVRQRSYVVAGDRQVPADGGGVDSGARP